MVQAGHLAAAAAVGERATPAAGGSMSLVFRAGSLLCALRLDEVIETMRPLAVQPLAGTASFVRGICVMRGTPAPVIDVALLLGGHPAPATRFVAVRTDRGVAAFATGAVLGTRPTVTTTNKQHARLLGVAPARLVAAIGTVDTEPLIQLASLRMVPDHVWASATAEDSPS